MSSHWPLTLQALPCWQSPQLALQPSLPQTLPSQEPTQEAWQTPSVLQLGRMPGQMPQLPPQPSEPHSRVPQTGVQGVSVLPPSPWAVSSSQTIGVVPLLLSLPQENARAEKASSKAGSTIQDLFMFISKGKYPGAKNGTI